MANEYLDKTGLTHFWDNIKGEIGNASDAQVDDWLDRHPEATTTVQDGAITTAKLANGAVTDEKLAQSGGVLEEVDELRRTMQNKIRTVFDSDLLADSSRSNATINTVTFTWNESKTACTINGTNSSSAMAALYFWGGTQIIPDGIIPGETYVVSITTTDPTNTALYFYFYNGSGAYISQKKFTASGEVTIPSATGGVRALLAVAGNATVSNAVISGLAVQKGTISQVYDEIRAINEAMIEQDANIDTKAPAIIKNASGEITMFEDGADNMLFKSIVCTISDENGKTGVNGALIGNKNYFDPESSFPIVSGDGRHFQKVCPDGDFIVSLVDNDTTVSVSGMYLGWAYDPSSFGSGFSWILSNGSYSIPVNNTVSSAFSAAGRKMCYLTYSPATDATLSAILRRYKIQVESGTSATTFQAFKGESFHLDWSQSAGTVYNGNVDLVSGKLTVESNNTSTVYDLTPIRMRTLYGNNIIWSDANNIECQYPADTEMVISNTSFKEDNINDINLDAEITGFPCYGQSWAEGYDTTAQTTAQRYDSIMLNTGLMNEPLTNLTVDATSFVPLIEQTRQSSSESYHQNCGETPCSSQTNIVKQLLLAENGYDTTDIVYQLFSVSPGYGSQPIENLSRGTNWYNRFIASVQAAKNIADGLHKGFVVSAFSWAQGTSTTGDNVYYEKLEQLRQDLDTDIKAITGQTQAVKCIAWQAIVSGSAGWPRRYYERTVYASEIYENIICSGTHYQLDHIADNNLHLTADSQNELGAQFGVAYKRTVIDGVKFVPLKPISVEVLDKVAYLKFNVPSGKLVFDTTKVAFITNYGFQLFDASNNEKTISDVAIISPDTVKIYCASGFNATDHIIYGGNGGDAYNPQTGKRGNLRDTQGNEIKYTTQTGVVLPIHNWCVIFDKTIQELSE